MTQRRYYQDPPIVTTPLDDVWAVLVPRARTNEVTNPSFETATTGYTAGAGSLARSTTQQYHGAYSGAYTPSAATTDGFYYTLTSTVALRAVSCKFLGQKGVPYALAYASTAPVELVTKTFIATGRWQWIWLYVNETSATTRRIYFRKNSSTSTATFYVDGVQSETLTDASESVSTYIDGDQLGLVPNQSPPAYIWNGTPHASTSTRSGLTRAGGEVKLFRDYGFTLIAMIGLGLAVPQNVATEYARLDGGYDDYTRKPTRQFTLSGRFDGRSYDELRDNRGGLADLLDRDRVGLDQRLVLTHYIEDQCGAVTTSTCRVLAKYQGGLDGNVSSQIAEQTPITFTQYLPVIGSDGEAGASLSVQLSIAGANGALKRVGGTWQTVSTGFGGLTAIATVMPLPDGRILYSGSFTSAGATSADYAAVYTPSTDTFAVIAGSATTFNATVEQAALLPDGRVVLVGGFANAGDANGDSITVWNPTADTLTSLGTGASQAASTAVDSSGRIFWGSDFTIDVGGVAATNGIGYYDTSWHAMGTGLTDGDVQTILPVGSRIYIGGSFTAINGAPNTSHVAYYSFDDNAWHSISSSFTGTIVNEILRLNNGMLLVLGNFTVIGGVSANSAALYNGTTFIPVTGMASGVAINDATYDPITGTVWLAGNFTAIGGISAASGFAKLIVAGSSATFVQGDIDPPGVSVIQAVGLTSGGDLYVGFNLTGTAATAATTTITNTGTARTYPTLTIKGPSSGTSRIYTLANETTGRTISMSYTMNAGETAVLVLQPDNLSFTSDFQGNIMSTILPGSNTADFFLNPGANVISFYAADSTVTATIRWRPQYVSLDDVP